MELFPILERRVSTCCNHLFLWWPFNCFFQYALKQNRSFLNGHPLVVGAQSNSIILAKKTLGRKAKLFTTLDRLELIRKSLGKSHMASYNEENGLSAGLGSGARISGFESWLCHLPNIILN